MCGSGRGSCMWPSSPTPTAGASWARRPRGCFAATWRCTRSNRPSGNATAPATASPGWCITATEATRADSTGGRNTSTWRCHMGGPGGWVTGLTGCAPMKSPGRPSLRREVERGLWLVVATGVTGEEAAHAVGVFQAAGARWFREGGGMPTIGLAPRSGRYLCFVSVKGSPCCERRVRVGERSPVNWVDRHRRPAGAAPRCGRGLREARLSSVGRPVEGRAGRPSTRDREARDG